MEQATPRFTKCGRSITSKTAQHEVSASDNFGFVGELFEREATIGDDPTSLHRQKHRTDQEL
jgi:hypothetical protein